MEKEFRVDEVFVMKRGKEAAPNRVPDGNVNMVNETSANNGITKRATSENIFGPSITVSVNYATTVFYQPEQFCASVNILILQNENLNEVNAKFIVAQLRKNNRQYDYNHKISRDRLAETVLSLPVTPNSDPDHEYTPDDIDWAYMERYIAELEQERIAELEAYLKVAGLDDCALTAEDEATLAEQPVFAEFKVGDLFDKAKTKNLKKDFVKEKDTRTERDDEFCVPLVNAKLGDNGVMFYGRKEDWKTEEMCIDVIQNGAVATGKVYVQPEPTAVLWDAHLIKPKMDISSVEVLLYLAACIEKSIRDRFSRDDKAYWGKVKLCEISLPVVFSTDSDHAYAPADIDWGYMERYIRAIEKLAIVNVVNYKDKVVSITKQVLGSPRSD